MVFREPEGLCSPHPSTVQLARAKGAPTLLTRSVRVVLVHGALGRKPKCYLMRRRLRVRVRYWSLISGDLRWLSRR
jgi:hypothetical protein